ncbi:MAG: thioesterase family protein [Mycobacteriaceae bacterium]|uniref:thioesterase family protein n=1 Tax=Corynebacterium sp. TaxID=1720 RepID=UPI003F96012F
MTPITDAYFLPGPEHTDDTGQLWSTFTATGHTESPWGPGFQHGSPPAALVAHALERAVPDGGRLVRVTTELLGAVPIEDLTVAARVVRPGRRISLYEVVVTGTSGREVVRGSGWWVRSGDSAAIENPDVPSASVMVPLRDAGSRSFSEMWGGGYIDSLETRAAAGQLWLRSTVPVVAGVPDTPWTRIMGVADVANGTNPAVDPGEWGFMNTDLTVYLHRLPRGEWTGIVAEANYGPDGIGLTVGRLHDQDGPVGTTNQALMLEQVGR